MLPSNVNLSKVGRCLPVLIAALIFAGCAPHTSEQAPLPSASQDKGTAGSAWYLQQMQQSADDSKSQWQLLAIHALLNEGQLQQAVSLFDTLPQNLSEEQQREQALLRAQIKIAQHDYAAAAAVLDKINPSALDTNQQKIYYRAVIDASQNKPSLALLRAYIAEEPLLKGEAHQKNIDDIWQALTLLTPEQMNTMVINADENTLQGWLELQQIWSTNRADADKLKSGIQEWQIRYPNNPGATSLPTQLTQPQAVSGPASVEKIALLLPLNGQASLFAQTIQHGFDAAKNGAIAPPAAAPDHTALDAAPSAYPALQPDASVAGAAVSNPVTSPAPPGPQSGAQIKVYDTSSTPVDQALAQAQQDGATLVVGPLLKNEVDSIVTSNSPLNILALNQPETVQNKPNICYFALSPEDEARDAAQHIWQQNHRMPLLLIPSNALGDRVAKAFASEWKTLGGGTVLQQRFGSISDLKRGINSGSGIALTGTPVITPDTAQNSVTIGGLTIPAPPTDDQIMASNGGNVDAVYIVATSDEIGLIKPMITMRTGSRSAAQLYASSRSAQASSGPDFRLEMEGLQFSEIPMLSGGNPQLMQQALASVNNDYSLARLYAMGADAWSLANHFSELRQTPGYSLKGNTGQLSASADCVINRKLNWLQFTQGQIVPVS